VTDYWLGPVNEDGRQTINLLVSPSARQPVLDALQGLLSTSDSSRILVAPLEAVLPHEEASPGESATSTTREELYLNVSKGAHLDGNFALLVILSTIVATIGLLEDNTAVIIGAMVIAPLLGPNIALALATALGDTPLMWQALKTNLTGILLVLLISVITGYFWPFTPLSHELLSRTDVGMDGIALALASGAAAVLSLTTGLSSVLVGVMVAVALLPPAATMGLMLGSSHWNLAIGAGLLLAINIVCVNLSAKLVFLFKGVKPRTWLEKRKARQSMLTYISFWAATLLILLLIILFRQQIVSR
jgi:uncharacterized hydrophobic protein (TIGR00341 family)